MKDVYLSLGGFTFERFEVPERINFGGDHKLIVHELVGGRRVIDAMGAQPAPIEWSGFFTGGDAVSRALELDAMRKDGLALDLTWGELAYSVVIRSFKLEFERFYRVPYKITCEVLEDLTSAGGLFGLPGLDDLINGDLGQALGLSSAIGDSTLSGMVDGVSNAVKKVGSIAKAAQSTLNSVLQPVSAVRTQVLSMVASANRTIQSVTTVGGVLPGNSASQQANNLMSQIDAVDTLPKLLQLDNLMGRMQANIGTVNGGTKQIIVAGGNLMQLAAQEYGDPMGWTAIANANGLADPQLNGITTLLIPNLTNNTGGVLNG